MTLSLTTLANDVTRYVRNDGGVDYYEIDPSELMKLIAIARMAVEMYAMGEERKFLTTERWDEIKEALREVTE